MKRFVDLYTALDETNRTNDKIDALRRYFSGTPPEDAAWAIYFLSGRTPRRAVSARKLSEWAAEEANIPMWLFGECYDVVGDIAETITLVIPETGLTSDLPLIRVKERNELFLKRGPQRTKHDTTEPG